MTNLVNRTPAAQQLRERMDKWDYSSSTKLEKRAEQVLSGSEVRKGVRDRRER
jgi:hypothetical protein